MAHFHVEYRKGVKIEVWEEIRAPDTGEMGAFTFVWDNNRYFYGEIGTTRDKIDELWAEKEFDDVQDKTKKDTELGNEIESSVEVAEFVAPALPWYVSWLKPVLEFIGALTKAVVDYFAPVFAPINRAADYIRDLPKGLIENIIGGVTDIYTDSASTGANVASQMMADINEGSPAWQEAMTAQINRWIEPVLEEYVGNLEIEGLTGELEEIEEAANLLGEWRNKILIGALANFLSHTIAEAGTLGQLEALRDFDNIVIGKLGLNEVASKASLIPFETGIFRQAEYHYNQKHPVLIPTQTQLIEMVVKEVMPLDDFKAWMRMQGFNEGWSQNIWDAHFRAPTWGELLNAYYRGNIDRDRLEELKILVDLDPRYNVVWDSLIEVIPPYQEIVNQRVKEVIGQEEFETYLQALGYNKEWAAKIWAAHFLPPSLGDMLTAWRRGIITEDRLDELMILVDLDPRFKEIFDTRKYNDPSITQARFMFEVGAINRSEVAEIVKKSGSLDADIEALTTYIVEFQERLWRRRYIVQLQKAFEMGIVSEDDLRRAVFDANYTEGVAHWIIETSNLRNQMKEAPKPPTSPKVLSLGDLKRAFNTDIINEDSFRTELLVRGYEIGEVDILITLENEKKVAQEAGGRKIALSQTELINAWRYNQVTEDYVRTELQLRGMELDEIDILINTKKLQWGVGT